MPKTIAKKTSLFSSKAFRWGAFFFLFFLCQCAEDKQATVQSNQPFRATPIEVPKVEPGSLGDMRIALIGPAKSFALVFVNHSNRMYLFSPEGSSVPRSEIHPSALQYKASFLSSKEKAKIVILEDEIMAQLEGLLQQLNFYSMAIHCKFEEVERRDWPIRDTILVEKNGRLYVMTREESLVDSNRRRSESGKVYVTIKNNLLLAQRYGYHIIYVDQRLLDAPPVNPGK